MRSASSQLINHLNSLRTGDARAYIANLYEFTLRTGTVLSYTDTDVPVTWNSRTYLANSVQLGGLKFKSSAGLEVDQQQITISARETDTVGGIPFLQALRNGVFDGCGVTRELIFFPNWGETPIGSVLLFKGRIGAVDKIGRTSAEVTVNSDLVLLDKEMPRRTYTPNCQHVLYDTGCGLNKYSFTENGAAEAGSTRAVIVWVFGKEVFSQGTIVFTSGANNGVTANVKQGYSGSGGGLILSFPLLNTPVVGDTFTVYQGCAHTIESCRVQFNNIANFLGFPYIPPPVSAT